MNNTLKGIYLFYHMTGNLYADRKAIDEYLNKRLGRSVINLVQVYDFLYERDNYNKGLYGYYDQPDISGDLPAKPRFVIGNKRPSFKRKI